VPAQRGARYPTGRRACVAPVVWRIHAVHPMRTTI
jgi:hypothetical protein